MTRVAPALEQLADDWLSTDEAAELLCIDPGTLRKVPSADQTVRNLTVPVSRPGRRNARGNVAGERVWWRRDVEDLARLRKRWRVSLSVALRIMAAERPRDRGAHR